jgi:hypothetical protein
MPVLKLTQVGKYENTKGTKKLSLRNSANYSCNFGKKETLIKLGLQVNGPSDCFSKTQVSAKFNDDVWRLTPAQCQKVKEKSYYALFLSSGERRL